MIQVEQELTAAELRQVSASFQSEVQEEGKKKKNQHLIQSLPLFSVTEKHQATQIHTDCTGNCVISFHNKTKAGL